MNFSFHNLIIEETDERKEILKSRIKAANISKEGYNQAIQQELLKDIATNPGSGGIAGAGAGLGMGIAAGNVFGQMAASAFTNPTQQSDPVETLMKMKQMLDMGLITQQIYDAKVAEIMSRM